MIASNRETHVTMAVSRAQGATGHTVDMREEASVAEFFEKLGSFDHLAITAGDRSPRMFGSCRDLDLEEARNRLTVRFWGVLAAAKHCSKTIAQDGSITLTSGMLAHRPRPGTVLSTAVGGAIESLTRGLAMDLLPVRVNCVCPGLVLTEIVKQRPEPVNRTFVEPLPISRGALPEEAARA